MGRSPISAGDKDLPLEEVVAAVPDGATVALGGWGLFNAPMALVRALARAGKKELIVVAPPASVAPDLLIGAGCVRTVYCVYLSFEHLGRAPHFVRAAESGALRVVEFDLTGLAAGLRAAAASLPWYPIPDLGTDLQRVNADWYRALPGADSESRSWPRTGDSASPRLLAVPPLAPDVALLHAQQGDFGGNCQLFGGSFLDPLLAQAARKTYVSVDALVDYDALRRAPAATKLPEFIVDGVVHLPYGAHPTGSHGRYEPDESHLGYYLEAAETTEQFARYLSMFVTSPQTHEAYLDAVGRPGLRDLHRA